MLYTLLNNHMYHVFNSHIIGIICELELRLVFIA